MNNRANVTYPFEKEGVKLFSELDSLMLKYYRVPNETEEGALSIEAFQVGQHLQFYFSVYNSVVINETMENKKFNFPDGRMAFAGLEAPFKLLLDNAFYQNNFQVIISTVINELTRMNTSRALPKENLILTHSLQLCSYEYLSVIAGLVAGTKAQREMDIEIRQLNAKTMEMAIEAMKKIRGIKPDV